MIKRREVKPRAGRVFGYSNISEDAAYAAADRLMEEEGLDWYQASQIVSRELDAAGEALTVESMATCRALGGHRVKGLTGPDSVTERTDRFAKSERIRNLVAELGIDQAGEFIFQKNRDWFIQDHGTKLVEAAILLGLREEFFANPQSLSSETFDWEKLRRRMLEVINEKAKKAQTHHAA